MKDNARVAQLVERDLAKVEAAGSSPVSRSIGKLRNVGITAFLSFSLLEIAFKLRLQRTSATPEALLLQI